MKRCSTFDSVSGQKLFLKRHVKFQLLGDRMGQVTVLEDGRGHSSRNSWKMCNFRCGDVGVPIFKEGSCGCIRSPVILAWRGRCQMPQNLSRSTDENYEILIVYHLSQPRFESGTRLYEAGVPPFSDIQSQ